MKISRTLVLCLCIALSAALAIGSTMAYFTDVVEINNNILEAGTLDIELYNGPMSDETHIEKGDKLFELEEGQKWEPGMVVVENLTIANVGTQAFKYRLNLNEINANTVTVPDGIYQGSYSGTYDLTDVLHAAYVPELIDPATTARAEVMAKITDGVLVSNFVLTGNLKAAASKSGALVIYWPENNKNDFDNIFNLNNGRLADDKTKVMKIDFGVNAEATQFALEEDSFDEKYDEAADFTTDVWFGAANELPEEVKNESGETEYYLITTAEQLAAFAAEVNAGTDKYKGKTVKLGSNIDLNNRPWTPIGTSDNGTKRIFDGSFDGQGHTIFNLRVTKGGGWNGLFGLVGENTTTVEEKISNLTIKNVTIDGTDRMSGAVVGQMYGNIENCHVENVTILAEPNWVGNGYDNGDKIGGIVGWLGDNNNNHYIKNCSAKNVTIKAYRDMGGITGYIAKSSTVEGCAVEDIRLTVDQMTNHYGDKTANANGVVGRIYSEPVYIDNNTEKNVSVSTVTAMVDSTEELLNAIDAVQGAETIVLTKDMGLALDSTLTLAKGTDVTIDLNGHTLTGESEKTGANYNMIDVRGTLTVANGSMVYEHKGADMGWNNSVQLFNVTAGGVLNIRNAVLENKGGSAMAFIAHLNNWGEVTLNVEDSTLKSTYCAVRVFNSGYDMNNVTIKNSTLESSGSKAFWVHNYIGDLDKSKHPDDAVRARLNFNIFNNGNTFKASGANPGPICYGFADEAEVFFLTNGTQVYK